MFETPVCSPSKDKDSSSDDVKGSVILDSVNKPPEKKQKLETPVDSPPIDKESSDVKHVGGNFQYCGKTATRCTPPEGVLAKVALHCYNSYKGTNLQYLTVTEHMLKMVPPLTYELTLDAIDPGDNSFHTIETCVWDAAPKNHEDLRLVTTYCTLKGSDEGGSQWDPNGVDMLYKGVMPKWLDDGALTGSEYYEVNKSDLQENEWLHLYAEVAAYSKWHIFMVDHLPLEITKVVVQTKEDMESSLKLKAGNAIFYISFKARGGVECSCIVRQTRDGRPHHMCLEVKNVDGVEIWQNMQNLETPVYSPPIDKESPSSNYGGNVQYCGKTISGCISPDEVLAMLALHCYNSHKGTNLKYQKLTNLMLEMVSFFTYEMTLDAIDPADNSLHTIETCVWDAAPENHEDLRLVTTYCTLKGSDEGGSQWDPNGVDVLYKGVMPKWLDDGTLTGSEYYEVNESDLQENEWLYLYALVGAYSKWDVYMVDHLPLEITKAVVQTKEDIESSLKLKSGNAIFYISFKARGGVDCSCIVRQTRDGRPEHMCLEVKNVEMDK